MSEVNAALLALQVAVSSATSVVWSEDPSGDTLKAVARSGEAGDTHKSQTSAKLWMSNILNDY